MLQRKLRKINELPSANILNNIRKSKFLFDFLCNIQLMKNMNNEEIRSYSMELRKLVHNYL